MQAQAKAATENYSLDTMIRYAFHYEVQNTLQIKPNQNREGISNSLDEF